jgi:hypothetical protein
MDHHAGRFVPRSVAIASDVGTPVDDVDDVTGLCQLAADDGTGQTGADDQNWFRHCASLNSRTRQSMSLEMIPEFAGKDMPGNKKQSAVRSSAIAPAQPHRPLCWQEQAPAQ